MWKGNKHCTKTVTTVSESGGERVPPTHTRPLSALCGVFSSSQRELEALPDLSWEVCVRT